MLRVTVNKSSVQIIADDERSMAVAIAAIEAIKRHYSTRSCHIPGMRVEAEVMLSADVSKDEARRVPAITAIQQTFKDYQVAGRC